MSILTYVYISALAVSSVDYRGASEIRLLALRIASEETTHNGVTMLRDLATIEFLARVGHEDEFISRHFDD